MQVNFQQSNWADIPEWKQLSFTWRAYCDSVKYNLHYMTALKQIFLQLIDLFVCFLAHLNLCMST